MRICKDCSQLKLYYNLRAQSNGGPGQMYRPMKLMANGEFFLPAQSNGLRSVAWAQCREGLAQI